MSDALPLDAYNGSATPLSLKTMEDDTTAPAAEESQLTPPPAAAVIEVDDGSESEGETEGSSADAVKKCTSIQDNCEPGPRNQIDEEENKEPAVEEEEEDREDAQSSSSSEPNCESDQKPSLDRFAFLTSVRIEPRGPRRYDIFGDAGLPILQARVRFHSQGGGCCGGGGGGGGGSGQQCRPFLVNVCDFSSHQLVMRVLCSRHCDVVVESPPHEVIGYLTAERLLCSVRFTVRDLHGNPRLVARCPRYCRLERAEAKFQPRRSNQVLLADGSDDAVATVTSAWTATAGSVASHTLDLPEAMSNGLKAMLIAVALLFDRKLFV